MFGAGDTGVESAVASMPTFTPTQTNTHTERHKQTHTDTHTHREKRETKGKKKKLQSRNYYKAVSPRSKRYYFSHSRASRIQCSMAPLF